MSNQSVRLDSVAETQMKKRITVEFIENFLIVWDANEGSELYKMGYYGKPLGIPKPKMAIFNTPLILDLMEGLYLAESKIIEVKEKSKSKKLGLIELRKRARKLYDNFDLKYTVYRDLKANNFIVTPGIKYGCDFAVYKHGPGHEHAPFMVTVKKSGETMTATEIVKAGRLATTVRKRFIVAVPGIETKKIEYLIFKWFKA